MNDANGKSINNRSKINENPQTSHGRDGRTILLIYWLLFFMGSTGMRSPICVPLNVSMHLGSMTRRRASAGNRTAASRQHATPF